MPYFFEVCLFSAFISISSGIFVFFNGLSKKHNFLWLLITTTLNLFLVGVGFLLTTKNYHWALFWVNWVYAPAAIFLPPLYLHFTLELIGLDLGKKDFILTGYILSGIVFLAHLFGLFVLVAQNSTLGYTLIPLRFYHFYNILFVATLVYSLVVMNLNFRKLGIFNQQRVQYHILSTCLGFFAIASVILFVYGLLPYPPGMFLVCLYVLPMTYALCTYRLMKLRQVLIRCVIFISLYAVTLLLPVLLLLKMDSFVVPILSLFVVTTAVPYLYQFCVNKVEQRMFARQRAYQDLLIQTAGGMVKIRSLKKLLKMILYILKRTVGTKVAAIYLYDRDQQGFYLQVSRSKLFARENALVSMSHPIVKVLSTSKRPFFLEEIMLMMLRTQDYASLKKIKTLFDDFGVQIVIPSFEEKSLLGFLMLGARETGESFTKDDVVVFHELAQQASLAIDNCLFFDKFRKAQQRISIAEAEKAASIGGMADGVAHQIKNRLNHFSIASGELQFEIKEFIQKHADLIEENHDLEKTFEYLVKIAESLLGNVKKTNGIIQGFLDFARVEQKETFFSGFSFDEVVNLAIEQLKVKHQVLDFPLVIKKHADDIFSRDDTIYGVKSQIMEAIFNLLDNAYEAIQERILHIPVEERVAFKPDIKLAFYQEKNVQRIEVVDNGYGIRHQDRRKIFAPFFTTKSSYTSGAGIGMYVVKRIIEENHKGKIWFDSQEGQGTSFFVELPRK